MEEKKQIILLDVEEVIFFGGFLKAVNEFLGTDYKIDDFTNYYIDAEAIPENRFDDFKAFLKGRNLFENPDILPGAIEHVKLLSKYYEIFLCTDSINPFDVEGSARNFMDKYNLLGELLPFIDPFHYIFTSNKALFVADIQIDDRLSKMNNAVGKKVLFPSYHNLDVTDEQLEEAGAIRAGTDWRTGWENVGRLLVPNYDEEIKKILVP